MCFMAEIKAGRTHVNVGAVLVNVTPVHVEGTKVNLVTVIKVDHRAGSAGWQVLKNKRVVGGVWLGFWFDKHISGATPAGARRWAVKNFSHGNSGSGGGANGPWSDLTRCLAHRTSPKESASAAIRVA